MLKRLTKREVSPDQREFAERTAHVDRCRAECEVAPLCHNHGDHYVVEWNYLFEIIAQQAFDDPQITCF